MKWYDYLICIFTAYFLTGAVLVGDVFYFTITYFGYLYYTQYRKQYG